MVQILRLREQRVVVVAVVICEGKALNVDTYPIRDRDGRMFAFEIENVYICVRSIEALLRSVPDVADIRVRKLFSSEQADIHIKFTYLGHPFMVWEPYADSSRYWFGPIDDTDRQIDVSALENVFQQYRPFFVMKILGDLVSLKFLVPFKKWLKSTH